MPKAPIKTVQGFCEDDPLYRVQTKTWKQGHSIKCEKRGSSSVRWWQPDKDGYYQTKFTNSSDIRAEVWDFCRACKHYKRSFT